MGRRSFDARELACGLLAVDVTLNGVTMPALVDTGAPRLSSIAPPRASRESARVVPRRGVRDVRRIGGVFPFRVGE